MSEKDEILLTTIDGFEVRDTDKIWVIRNPYPEIEISEIVVLSNIYPYYKSRNYWFFKSKENAIRYLKEKTQTVINFAEFPIPVVTPLGIGYVVYIKSNAIWENDEVCVAMEDDGQWRHFNSSQIKSYKNETYDIANKKSIL